LLPAALHGAQEQLYAGAEKDEVGEHLDDEHDPGGLGLGGVLVIDDSGTAPVPCRCW